jgi:hypothetical protein
MFSANPMNEIFLGTQNSLAYRTTWLFIIFKLPDAVSADITPLLKAKKTIF